MASRSTNVLEVLRAANPVDETTVPGPDAPQARALLAEITAMPRTVAQDQRSYSRRRVVVAIAVALLALASLAAAWLAFRDVSDPLSVVCYEAPTLDSSASDATIEGELDVSLCGPVWEDSILVNEDVAPAGQVPPLVGCVTEQGNLAVFPSEDPDLCTQLDLARANPESIPAGDPIRQLDADLVEHFGQQSCQSLEDAERDVRQILDSNGFPEWRIEITPGPPTDDCASFGLDADGETIYLIPIPDLG